MNDLEFHPLIINHKDLNIIETDIILYSINLLTDIKIPKTLLFRQKNIPNISIDIVKSEFKSKTNTLYYGDGIIGNLYDIENCDRNWVLGYFFIKENYISFKSNIKCFLMGCGNCSFIDGINYFLKTTKYSTYDKKYDVEWLGMDIIKKSNTKFNENIVDGYECNDLKLFDNLNHCKYCIENKFNKINLIFNDIKPNLKNNKTLISASILSLSVLKNDGILLTKILAPEYWDDAFLHYILLFVMLFNDVKVVRYPINLNNYCLYNYYLMCTNKKIILHCSIIYRKLISILKRYDIDKLLFLQNIVTNKESVNFIKHLSKIRQAFIDNNNDPIKSMDLLIENFNLDHFK
jgi:hypothetical protein